MKKWLITLSLLMSCGLTLLLIAQDEGIDAGGPATDFASEQAQEGPATDFASDSAPAGGGAEAPSQQEQQDFWQQKAHGEGEQVQMGFGDNPYSIQDSAYDSFKTTGGEGTQQEWLEKEGAHLQTPEQKEIIQNRDRNK